MAPPIACVLFFVVLIVVIGLAAEKEKYSVRKREAMVEEAPGGDEAAT